MGHDRDHGVTLEEARARVRACFTPVADVEDAPLERALGRVLAEDVIARADVPPFDNSAMDGWALAVASLTATTELAIAGEAFAGRPMRGAVPAGACARVMTGAPIPDGCDTVVMQEHAREEGGRVRVDLEARGARAGQHVRRAGEDVRANTVALAKGRALRPVDVGVCASVGHASVRVWRRPRVAFFSTGDELRPAGAPLGPGQLWDSNRHVLRASIERCGAEAIDLGDVGDDLPALSRALERVLAATPRVDALVTTGGVSVGVADRVFDAVRALGSPLGSVEALEVRMKPGRHYVIGRLAHALRSAATTAFVGLPGNPVANAVGFFTLVRPALLACAGHDPVLDPIQLRAIARSDFRAGEGRVELQRGVAWREHEGAAWSVRSTGAQGAGMLRSMAEANCLVILRGPVSQNETVDIQLLDS